jgi:hypothetical protein
MNLDLAGILARVHAIIKYSGLFCIAFYQPFAYVSDLVENIVNIVDVHHLKIVNVKVLQ